LEISGNLGITLGEERLGALEPGAQAWVGAALGSVDDLTLGMELTLGLTLEISGNLGLTLGETRLGKLGPGAHAWVGAALGLGDDLTIGVELNYGAHTWNLWKLTLEMRHKIHVFNKI
jgi:hypothetical protein